jgi:ssRNA-specific RNase YbeY (16S rRNA maturation enzyme)
MRKLRKFDEPLVQKPANENEVVADLEKIAELFIRCVDEEKMQLLHEMKWRKRNSCTLH